MAAAPSPTLPHPTLAPLPPFLCSAQAVDAALLGKLSDELKGYLSTRFTLRAGDRPHLMKF